MPDTIMDCVGVGKRLASSKIYSPSRRISLYSDRCFMTGKLVDRVLHSLNPAEPGLERAFSPQTYVRFIDDAWSINSVTYLARSS